MNTPTLSEAVEMLDGTEYPGDVLVPSSYLAVLLRLAREVSAPSAMTVALVALAIRRDRFVRTGRAAIFDASVPMSSNELSDARAVLAALSGMGREET